MDAERGDGGEKGDGRGRRGGARREEDGGARRGEDGAARRRYRDGGERESGEKGVQGWGRGMGAQGTRASLPAMEQKRL
jgi:hypothetical protein